MKFTIWVSWIHLLQNPNEDGEHCVLKTSRISCADKLRSIRDCVAWDESDDRVIEYDANPVPCSAIEGGSSKP